MSLDLEVLLKSRIASVTSPTHSALTLLEKSRIKVVHTGCLIKGGREKNLTHFLLLRESNKLSCQEYDLQKLKISSSALDRDLVVLVESSDPHEPSLVVEMEDSEVGLKD